MKRMLALLALCLLASLAWAEAPPLAGLDNPQRLQVRAHIEPDGALVQGETARLVVDVLTPEFFHEAPVLPLPHVDGLYVALTDEAVAHPQETIDGAPWSGVRRVYLITPLAGGGMTIPSFQVSASLGAQGEQVTANSPPVSLRVQSLPLPPGVSEALIASNVTVNQTITPAPGGMRVGDSVTRRIEISADGAPAMMIPPLHFPAMHGLSTYAASAQTRNSVGGLGGFMGGERVESVTYVIQQRGHYTLPPLRVRWMDVHTHQWRESSVPAVGFHAWWGAPSEGHFGVPGQGPVERLLAFARSDLGIACIVLALLAGVAWWFRAHLLSAWRHVGQWRERRRQSEPHAFRQLLRLRSSHDAEAVYRAVDAWLRRGALHGDPDSLDTWCRRFGDESLRHAARGLLAQVYGAKGSVTAWSATALVDALKAARQRRKAPPPWRRKVTLPPLNPGV